MRLQQFCRNYRTEILVALAVCLLTLLLYGASIRLGFFSDDWDQLSVTAQHTGSVWSYVTTNIHGTRGGSSYGPVFNFLLTAQFALFHWYAPLYHVVNLLIYAATAFVIFLFGKKITGQKLVGLFAALFFVVLPSHTEAVVWVAVQPHLFATLAYVIGLYIYSIAVIDQKEWYRYAGLGAMILSLFTKEIGLPFLAIFVLMEWCFSAHTVHNKRWWFKYVGFVAVSVGMIALYWALRHWTTGYGAGYYGQTSLIGSITAMKHMAVEMTLAIILPWPYRRQVLDWLFFHHSVLYVLFGAMLAAVALGIKRHKIIIWIGLSYVVTLLPFLPLLLSPWNNEGERYTYLPSVFFVLGLAVILFEVSKLQGMKKWYGIFGMVSVVVIGCVVQMIKLEPWQVADRVTTSIVQSVPALNLRPTDRVVFVGLPDTVAGAQVFRNAITEGIAATQGTVILSERIPMYAAPRVSEAEHMVYTLNPVSSTVYRLVGDHENATSTFTGFRSIVGTYARFTLEGWQKGDVGRSILITLDPIKIRESATAGVRVVFVYFSKGMLHGFVPDFSLP